MKKSVKKLGLICLMIINFCVIGYSQSCLLEGIIFTKQSQIDSFSINYPNCSKIAGNVTIINPDIQNLLGLNAITSIVGSISVTLATSLTGFAGLNNLDSIGGGFVLKHNSRLKNFTGLNNLKYISGGFIVYANDSLESFIGLSNLCQVDGLSFWIQSNFGLISLIGFDRLSIISCDIDIYNNSIINLNGLESLKSISGELKIHQNFYIRDINGLENVFNIGGDLQISSNDSLNSISGLRSLKTVEGSVDIHFNDALKSLSGLDSLNSFTGYLRVYSNDSLSKCAVKSICRFLSNPNGKIGFNNNLPGCNSAEEIQAMCDTLSIPENFPETQYLLYPNPAFDELTISNGTGKAISRINIFNQIGEIVLQIDQTNEPICISNLCTGYYLVEFNVGEKVVRKPFFKN